MRTTRPVIIINEESPLTDKKIRKVDIVKQAVYDDIDRLTYKNVDGSDVTDVRVRNAVSSDSSEHLDGAVIARYVSYRDAKLRLRFRYALAKYDKVSANDVLTLEQGIYRYLFSVPVQLDDIVLEPLAEFIHRYLVWGALYDWYVQFGYMKQASAYGSQLETLEEDMDELLRGTPIVKRPMQPFGPAEKF